MKKHFNGLLVERSVDTRNFRREDRYDRETYKDAKIDIRPSENRALLWYYRDVTEQDEVDFKGQKRMKDLITGELVAVNGDGTT